MEGSLSRYVLDGGVVRSDCIFKIHMDVVEGDSNDKYKVDHISGDTGGGHS